MSITGEHMTLGWWESMIKDVYGKPVPKTAYVIRHTEVGDFINCPRKWFFLSHNGLNLEPQNRSNKLTVGSLWHKMLEEYYKDGVGDFPSGLRALEEGIRELREESFNGMEFGEFGPDPTETKAQLDKDEELLRILFEGYPDWANHHAYPSDKEFARVEAERRMLAPLKTPKGNKSRAYLAAKLDGIVEKQDTSHWVLEHKTRGVSTSVSNPDGLTLDLQLGIQLFLLRQYVDPKYKVQGSIYNLVRKQKPGPRVKSPIYGRHQIFRSEYELELLEQYLYKIYREMKQASDLGKKKGWRAAGELRYNPQIWGGLCTWGCPVKNICEALNRGEDVEYLMRAELQPRDKTIMDLLEEEMSDD